MLRFVCVVAVAAVLVPHVSMGLRGRPFVPDFQESRSFGIQELCKWFCADDYDYDYSYRAMDHVVQPRIFCGLCKKKMTTTKPPTTETTKPPTTPTKLTPSTTMQPSTVKMPTMTPGPVGPTAAPTVSTTTLKVSTSAPTVSTTTPMAPAAPPAAASPMAPANASAPAAPAAASPMAPANASTPAAPASPAP